MKINWKVRMKNPLFWISIGGVILTAMGASPEAFTSWGSVAQAVLELVGNPYLLGSVILAVMGAIVHPGKTAPRYNTVGCSCIFLCAAA